MFELDFVSMPPRRSCFASPAADLTADFGGFNATTAFLLRSDTPDR